MNSMDSRQGYWLRGLLALLVASVAGIATVHAQPAAAPAHTTQIVLLGTKGGPTVDPERSEPANLLLVDGKPYLIDAGPGVARKLVMAGYPPSQARIIFLTHLHLDHSAGLESLMGLSWIGTGLSGKAEPPVEIYGPPATSFLVDAALRYISVSERIFRAGIPTLPTALSMFVAHDIDHDGLAYQDARIKVTAAENTHFHHPSGGPDASRDMSFSYRFDTPSGSVVFTGDTGPSDAVTRLATGADVLVSEVYLPSSGMPGSGNGSSSTTPLMKQLAEHMALEHLSPEEVGTMAARAGVKAVILTHIVAANSPALGDQLKARVQRYFKGPVIVGHDLLSYDLGKQADASR